MECSWQEKDGLLGSQENCAHRHTGESLVENRHNPIGEGGTDTGLPNVAGSGIGRGWRGSAGRVMTWSPGFLSYL